jgi:hypothetical protein
VQERIQISWSGERSAQYLADFHASKLQHAANKLECTGEFKLHEAASAEPSHNDPVCHSRNQIRNLNRRNGIATALIGSRKPSHNHGGARKVWPARQICVDIVQDARKRYPGY